MPDNTSDSMTTNESANLPAPTHQIHHHTVVMVNQKSVAVSYVLWFFLGNLGIHKFYLRQTGMGVLYLCLGLVGWVTSFLVFGFAFLGVLWIMMIVDLFLIPGRVRTLNAQLAPTAVSV
jgi:TM2 domain-containing membrane protein YozV